MKHFICRIYFFNTYKNTWGTEVHIDGILWSDDCDRLNQHWNKCLSVSKAFTPKTAMVPLWVPRVIHYVAVEVLAVFTLYLDQIIDSWSIGTIVYTILYCLPRSLASIVQCRHRRFLIKVCVKNKCSNLIVDMVNKTLCSWTDKSHSRIPVLSVNLTLEKPNRKLTFRNLFYYNFQFISMPVFNYIPAYYVFFKSYL